MVTSAVNGAAPTSTFTGHVTQLRTSVTSCFSSQQQQRMMGTSEQGEGRGFRHTRSCDTNETHL